MLAITLAPLLAALGHVIPALAEEATVYYDLTGSCGKEGDVAGSGVGPNWSTNENSGYPKCEGQRALRYIDLNSNQIVAVDSSLFQGDFSDLCGKEVKITKPDGSAFAYSGGPLYVWESCPGCGSARVDLSAAAFTELKGGVCGPENAKGITFEIVDNYVVDPADGLGAGVLYGPGKSGGAVGATTGTGDPTAASSWGGTASGTTGQPVASTGVPSALSIDSAAPSVPTTLPVNSATLAVNSATSPVNPAATTDVNYAADGASNNANTAITSPATQSAPGVALDPAGASVSAVSGVPTSPIAPAGVATGTTVPVDAPLGPASGPAAPGIGGYGVNALFAEHSTGAAGCPKRAKRRLSREH